jgi:Fe(3+) dicitrate transport protein
MSCNHIVLFIALFVLCLPPSVAQSTGFEGRILDSSGAAVPNAGVWLRFLATGAEYRVKAGPEGVFRLEATPPGDYEITVSAEGFATTIRTVLLRSGAAPLEIQLAPATLAQEVMVSANRIAGTPESLEKFPGSHQYISGAALTESRVFNTEEALRKATGVHARSEEGWGLRPNVGIRGLSPTRSTRVLLLEDGLPLSYAPYGDNASYYHPPVDRFDGIEVVKGGGQILYGPMTVGGVINYLTPTPSDQWRGFATVGGGNRNYLNGHLRYGGTWKNTGLLFDALRKQGEGARENQRHGLADFNVKSITTLKGEQTLGARFNYYNEDSNVTYSGLRESEWLANPRGNPFRNDFFYIHRYGTSLNHVWAPRSNFTLSTNAYGSVFHRDWWRQSSNSNQRPNDAADPACGGMANLLTTCGNEGRLRSYYTWGLEPKARAAFSAFGAQNELDFGFRFHMENQDRQQRNGPLPTSRDGRLVEDNVRFARAWSGFVQNRFLWGKWSVTPGVRVEQIYYRRNNRLLSVEGDTSLTQVIPGIGAAYSPSEALTVFAGVHRGFAPPRVEDIINNNTGASVELDPERSWNYEAGVRTRLSRNFQFDATFFRMDFTNQIVPASVAGGIGAVLTNAGETLHQGMEFAGRHDWRSVLGSGHSFSIRGAYTRLGIARYESIRFSGVPGFAAVRITGNRLPYAPGNLLTSSVTYTYKSGLNAFIETVYTGRQFGDDLNTAGGTPDGQRGLIPGNALWNATLNYPVEAILTVKNVFDRLTIADRTRGLLPGPPRLIQAGIQFSF